MSTFPELSPATIPIDPELRWVGELRDFLRRGTFGIVLPDLRIKEARDKPELYAYLKVSEPIPGKLSSVITQSAYAFARIASSKYTLQRISWDETRTHLVLTLCRKPERYPGRKH